MVHEVEAVYENGVLRPLEPLPLAESEQVRIRVSTKGENRPRRDLGIVEFARAEVAKWSQIPSHDELRKMLADVPGSFADDVDRDRGEH